MQPKFEFHMSNYKRVTDRIYVQTVFGKKINHTKTSAVNCNF